jgi:hypothetical protein
VGRTMKIRCCTIRPAKDDKVEVFRLLIEHGVDINARDSVRSGRLNIEDPCP